MALFERIRQEIPVGTHFETPSRKKPFTVVAFENDLVEFSVGRLGSSIKVPRVCWDGIEAFLRGRGWVIVGQKHDVADANTFAEFLDSIHLPNQNRNPDWASYVVPVLERLRIVDVETKPRTKIRLGE